MIPPLLDDLLYITYNSNMPVINKEARILAALADSRNQTSLK
jgi:hypothetical protein